MDQIKTRKQRAEIYLEAAQIETESKTVNYLQIKSGIEFWRYCSDEKWKVYPELELFDNDVSTLSVEQRDLIRPMALLFAYQIAKNP